MIASMSSAVTVGLEVLRGLEVTEAFGVGAGLLAGLVAGLEDVGLVVEDLRPELRSSSSSGVNPVGLVAALVVFVEGLRVVTAVEGLPRSAALFVSSRMSWSCAVGTTFRTAFGMAATSADGLTTGAPPLGTETGDPAFFAAVSAALNTWRVRATTVSATFAVGVALVDLDGVGLRDVDLDGVGLRDVDLDGVEDLDDAAAVGLRVVTAVEGLPRSAALFVSSRMSWNWPCGMTAWIAFGSASRSAPGRTNGSPPLGTERADPVASASRCASAKGSGERETICDASRETGENAPPAAPTASAVAAAGLRFCQNHRPATTAPTIHRYLFICSAPPARLGPRETFERVTACAASGR